MEFMNDYSDDLHMRIRDLFNADEIKFDIKMVKNDKGEYNHSISTGIRVTHVPTGAEVVCEDYETQVQNANIALLRLKKLIAAGIEPKAPG
jgi:protein subunit release factor A